jgi:hypothetical protein
MVQPAEGVVAARMEKAVVVRVQVAIKLGLTQSSKNLSGKVVHYKPSACADEGSCSPRG